jgi:disulfide bond formation protein DsbB
MQHHMTGWIERRTGNLLGVFACLGLTGYAYYAQYGLGLEPCPLCILQRVAVIGVGVLFLLAWLMRYQSDLAILLVFAGCGLALLGPLVSAERAGWRWNPGGWPRLSEVVARRVPWLKVGSHLPRWANLISWIALTVYLALVAAVSTSISRDVAWLALGLAVLLLLALLKLVPMRVIGGLVHAAVFVTMATAVYLDHFEPTKPAVFTAAKWLLFPVLLLAVLMRVRFWRQRRFEVTTLDVLVVFLAVVLPNLPGLQGAPSSVGLSVAKRRVVMYAAEILVRHSERTRAALWASAALALGVVAARGLALGT